MNKYVLVNGKVMNDNASLEDIKLLTAKLNLKLVKAYTFKMKHRHRRVLQYEAQGLIYSVHGPKNWLDFYSYSQNCIYFGFDKKKAYSLSSKVSEFEAREINFSQPHLTKLFLESEV